jgi:branched-chain amino acid transport system ATP-binding protein
MLSLERVRAGYGHSTVLHDVSLYVPDGSLVALLGPNGAGKSTLLKVAAGLLRPKSGRVRLDGEEIGALRPHQRADRGICLIPEGRGVFPNLSVRDNLVLHAAPGDEQSGVERAVSAFPVLGERLDQIAGTLSGGEQQMLSLSRAHVRRPSVALIDEVSMGLAPKIVEELFASFSALAAAGTSLLLVEQYVARALELADYVYVLTKGSLVFAGEPSELDQSDYFDLYVGSGR